MIDLSNKTTDELKNLIANHARIGKASHPLALAAQAELTRKQHPGLDFETSMELIKTAAKQGHYLSYRELADGSGAEWNKVYLNIGKHLGALITYADGRKWPLLSAIVVNAEHKQTGRMAAKTLRGFVAAARALGHDVGTDDEAFLRAEQARVFEWARTQA